MPNFEAKNKAEFQGRKEQSKPGDKVPVADENGLRPLGANEFYPRHWQYLHEKHTLDDFRRSGYFTGDARDHLRVGDTIAYTLCGGEKLPSKWQRGVAVVEEIPSMKELPLILAGYVAYEQPVAWREEKPNAAQAKVFRTQ